MLILVDDNKSILLFLEYLLDDLGYRTRSFTSAEAALTFLRESPEPVRLVVSDQRLPGMNGLEFLRHVSQLQTEARRLLISGLPPDDVPDGVITLEKPFRLEQFGEIVDNLLAGLSGIPARPCTAEL